MSSKNDDLDFERTIGIIATARTGNAEALASLAAAFERQGFLEDDPTFWKTSPLRGPAKELHYVALRPDLAAQRVFWAEIFFNVCHLINNELKLDLCWTAFSLDETSSSRSSESNFGLEHSVIVYTSARKPRRAFRYSLTRAYLTRWLTALAKPRSASGIGMPPQQEIGLCVTKEDIGESSDQLRFISVKDNQFFSHWESDENEDQRLLEAATEELLKLSESKTKVDLWKTYVAEYEHLVSSGTKICCHISSTRLFHSLTDESARAGTQLIVGCSRKPSAEQARLIHTFFQVLLSGIPALYSSLRRLNREAITLKRYRQQLNLLEAPLRAITDSLSGMQSNTQRLRSALYEPSRALFNSHVAISELFDEHRTLHASKYVKVRVQHNTQYTDERRCRNRDALPPERRGGTVKDGRVVLAVALLRIFGQPDAIDDCKSRTAIIRTARLILRECECDPVFAGLADDLRWLLMMKSGARLGDLLAGDVTGYLGILKAVLFDPFKLETKHWDKRALFLATRPYQSKRLGNPGEERVRFPDGASPVSFHTVLAFLADIAAYFAQGKINVADVGLVPTGTGVFITLNFDKTHITDVDGLHAMRLLVNKFILTQPRDWRTTDSATGNFRKPFVDIASRMLGVENKSSAWNVVTLRALSSTSKFWDIFAVKRRTRLFRVRFAGNKQKGHNQVILEWTEIVNPGSSIPRTRQRVKQR